ncbi:DNA polymerase III subunit psi [Shewanella metallivivens]|uniref:DNA polymerase III subunit psi n=1 Tax=Shewanella metallivivens TaxID=2872342 RepID=A0ABT5TRU0_9GAMM|nr:DNA polymerase III subunit psi [Shewanella metallivivens]MDD8061348.1 DNA polymerase III subunit psi [Shewanella metallivivens]
MDQSAFLDAMNITRWRSADKPIKPYLVLHDLDADLSDETFIADVLRLLNVKMEDCEFDCEMVKGPQVVWDMRKVKVRPRVAWIVSAPLSELPVNPQEKRQLWQQISQYLNKQQTTNGGHNAQH